MSLDQLLHRVQAQDGYDRIVWPWGEGDPPEAWLADAPGRVFLGGDYLTIPDLKVKYVRPDAAYFPYTAGELARAWLDSVLERAGKHRLVTGAFTGEPRFGPALFFDPPADRGGEWVMVDIKAAYWTLYSRVAFDCMFTSSLDSILYRPGSLRVPEEDREWVAAEKPLRNAVWGLMLPGRITWWEQGQQRSKPHQSRYNAPGLTQLVLAQMNAIAAECREACAVMWLTDAAICRPTEDVYLRAFLKNRWGLNAEVKAEGDGYLYGLGDYRIGNQETAGGHTERGPHDSLTPLTQTQREALAAIR